jgi:hypothetical protein
MKHAVEIASVSMIYPVNFTKIDSGIQIILEVITAKILEDGMLVFLIRGIYELLC